MKKQQKELLARIFIVALLAVAATVILYSYRFNYERKGTQLLKLNRYTQDTLEIRLFTLKDTFLINNY